MKKSLLFSFGLLLVGASLFSSCKKEGCTDSDADNYSSEAKKDDNSCTYSGEYVLWYGQSTAASMINVGSTSLTFYVDGDIVGSSATSVYWTSAPDCGQNGSVTISKNLGNVKSKASLYRVQDQAGDVLWEGVLNFSANTCSSLELVW